MTKPEEPNLPGQTRRDFIKSSTAAVIGTAALTHRAIIPGAYAAGSDLIRVGLIGCGGRGTGAASNALSSAPGVKLVAMGDVFKDRLEASRESLLKEQGDKVDVPDERCFVGFDAYEKVLAAGVDYVLLTTPPGFRPIHLKAAIAAGKHVFVEKPVAVDGPGIRMVLEAYEAAKAKGLGAAAGTQRRHQTGYLEMMKRTNDGAIGKLLAGRIYYNTGGLWKKDRQPGWTDMEWQLRNWLYFTWLSGDHIVEQHVHNIDTANWILNGHPLRAVGTGGRQQRTDPAYGHIFDHFVIDFEYADNVHVMSMSRQMVGCDNNVSDFFVGSKGNAFTTGNGIGHTINGETNWKLEGKDNNPYVQEHTDLIESIRAGKPLNELKSVAEATLTAIMGRMSAYTGKAITWEQALNSQEVLMPPKLEWGSLPVPPVAIPGQTEFV